MSKAKFAAAKELIDEKRYDEARQLLTTIDHPTAQEWLTKLDRIAPDRSYPVPPHLSRTTIAVPQPDDEATKYFRAQNRKRNRRRLGKNIELVMGGIFSAGIGIYLLSLPKVVIPGSPPSSNGLGLVFLLGGGLVALIGIIAISHRKTT